MGYYFISVGGSGARVLESLAHLCAAGLLPNNERRGQLYAMAIDPDVGNGNLNRTHTLLNCLNGFKNIKVGEGTPLLKTSVKLANPFVWSPTPKNMCLDDIIFYQNYSGTPLGKLYESLYTQRERMTELDVGFRGHPSIGAAVMGMKAVTDVESAWGNLINAVQSDVKTGGSAKIFLAGSVFGGTGAAGLPTIARLLREIFATYVQSGTVRIGGALLLPYFSFSPTSQQKEESGLFASSDNFLTNTKAALHYYADTGKDNYDLMYFIGDETMAPISTFSVGAATQRNDAHIVDLFAAMAALHFYGNDSGQHCYYISRNQKNVFRWEDFPDVSMEDGSVVSVRERFVQFVRLVFAYLYIVKPILQDLASGREAKNPHAWYVNYWQDKISAGAPEVRSFEKYAEDFAGWLHQVEDSSGARRVELINPKAFRSGNGQIQIDPDLFPELDYGSSKLTIKGVADLLASGEGGGFPWPWPRRRNQNAGTAQGFGLFLRRLYDSCKA